MACNCFGDCSCVIEAGPGITLVGSGDVADPWIISADDPTFAATNANEGVGNSAAIGVTPAGILGHQPTINLVLDPASPAPLSVTAAGLSVDAVSPGDQFITSVVDDDCINLDVTGGALQANIIFDPDAGLECGISGLLISRPAGVRYIDLDDGIQSNIPPDSPPASATAEKWFQTFTNNGNFPVYITIVGTARWDLLVDANLGRFQYEGSAMFNIDVGTLIGVNPFVNVSELGENFPSNEGITMSQQIEGTFLLGVGNTKRVALDVTTQNIENLLRTTATPPAGFVFTRVYAKYETQREDAFLVAVS